MQRNLFYELLHNLSNWEAIEINWEGFERSQRHKNMNQEGSRKNQEKPEEQCSPNVTRNEDFWTYDEKNFLEGVKNEGFQEE